MRHPRVLRCSEIPIPKRVPSNYEKACNKLRESVLNNYERLCRTTTTAGTSGYPCTVLIMSNIGMYIATTMPPITTPITTIITGSRMDVRAETAASTSSS